MPRMLATENKVTRASAVLLVGRVRVDTRRAVPQHKAVSDTRDATKPNNRAARRAVNVARLVAMMSKAILKADRRVTRAAAEPATAKGGRAVEPRTNKAERGINVDTRQANGATSKAGTRLGLRKAVKAEPAAIVVHRGAIRTIKSRSPFNPSPPTMTSAEDVAASSRTTHRSRHSINALLAPHGRLGLLEARNRNVVDLFLTKRILSKDRPAAIRLNVVRFADRAATIKRPVANFPLAAEVNVRLLRCVR